MGGVKMINHRGKNRQNLKIQISSYQKEISSKISNQLAQGLVTQYSSGYYY